MSYYGKLTGKHYESLEAMQHYESLEAQRRMVPTPEEDAFSNLPAEEQRAVVERMVAGDRQKVALAEQDRDISTFIELHPEYVDSPENSAAMKAVLLGIIKTRNRQTAMLTDIEDAFEVCKIAGDEAERESSAKTETRRNPATGQCHTRTARTVSKLR